MSVGREEVLVSIFRFLSLGPDSDASFLVIPGRVVDGPDDGVVSAWEEYPDLKSAAVAADAAAAPSCMEDWY